MLRRSLLFLTCFVLVAYVAKGDDSAPAESAPAPPVVEVDAPSAAAAKAETTTVLFFYCLAVMGASMAGGNLPSVVELTHNRMQTMISFVGGLMLGIGVFHMLPHAVYQLGSIDETSWWMMGGLLLMFFLLRTFHFHQHDVVIADEEPLSASLIDEQNALVPGGPAVSVHDHDCGHDHDSAGHDHHGHGHHHHAHRFSWVGITVGLCLHTLIDGIALGAAVEADAHHPVMFSLFGVGTFLAILLHKPLDALSITGLMTAGGWSRASRNFVNLGFALMCPLGAAAFLFGISRFANDHSAIVGAALAAAGGVFICIALSDLLPEMEFHSHNRVRLTLALLLGIALAWGIRFLEPAHAHNHGPAAPAQIVSERLETAQ